MLTTKLQTDKINKVKPCKSNFGENLRGGLYLRSLLRSFLCVMLVMCFLVPAYMIGAVDTTSRDSISSVNEQDNTGVTPRLSEIALDDNITSYGSVWIQPDGYPAYRFWVDNTTGALMTATITGPSGQTKNVYITAGSNKSYTNNDAEPGVYRVSFHTYGTTLSGTVRVRISTMPLV